MPNCSRNDTVCVLLLLLQHIQEAERDFMAFKELPHVAASLRIVRQVSRLAGSSFTRWMATMFACLAYVVQIFHSNHTKSDAVSFDWGRGWGRCRDRGWGMRVWRSYKMLITVERRHDAARCGVRFGVALLCIVMFTFVILMIRIPRKIATRVYCML